ncbi:MAG TPA: hypothetical protein PKJ99_16185, partial [Thermoanaerobaculales bacterium]|nr:hypothetical protein [Thermoanaerobaculales bacterium]HQL29968.1 hypothetical protein [Thermoanaerobaculales bacterium]HQN96855.1 hypothetical protein [Thermoanaerobaculales bacterium]
MPIEEETGSGWSSGNGSDNAIEQRSGGCAAVGLDSLRQVPPELAEGDGRRGCKPLPRRPDSDCGEGLDAPCRRARRGGLEDMMSRVTSCILSLGVILIPVAVLVADDTDMTTSLSGPAALTPGEVATFTMTYTNNGPAQALSAIPELYIPVDMANLTQEQYDFIQESTVQFDDQGNIVGTNDTLGNVALLFIEDGFCEDLQFQVNENPPVSGQYIILDAGASGSFTVDIPTPDVVKVPKLVITEPANLAQEWTRIARNAAGDTAETLMRASELNLYTRGSSCDDNDVPPGTNDPCEFIEDCFGPRLSAIEPIEAEFAIVDDGAVSGTPPDPLLGCGPLVNADEIAGRIALVRRGECYFSEKAGYIQDAGGVGVIVINNGNCNDITTSPDCIMVGMGANPTGSGGLYHIPIVQISQADGDELITAIQSGTTVHGGMGAYESDSVIYDTNTWFAGSQRDTDPLNDYMLNEFPVEIVPTEFVSAFPAAAYAAGLEGAFFQTDVDINNKGAEEASFTLIWLPRGADNSTPVESDPVVLAPGQSVQYENVLNAVFGLEPDVVGAIAMIADSPDVIGMSRTYNVPSAKIAGTFGQGLPAITTDQLIGFGETRRIIFMSENDDIRANVGCANALPVPVHIDLVMYDAAGTLLETRTMDLAPWSNNQINRIFRNYSPVNGYVDVSTSTEGGAFYCYGSVLDNSTSDPTTVLPQVPSDATTFIPAAALAAGLEGAFFSTDVDLNNAGAANATYQFGWLPRGADNTTPTMSDPFTLAAGASVRYENVLNAVFGAE